MCSNTVGQVHHVLIGGAQRCFSVVHSPSARRPSPVLIMHHGLTGDASQFCGGTFAQQALEAGIALVCSEAMHGSWGFASPLACLQANDAKDLRYVASIIGDSMRPALLLGHTQTALQTAPNGHTLTPHPAASPHAAHCNTLIIPNKTSETTQRYLSTKPCMVACMHVATACL